MTYYPLCDNTTYSL